jgi:hypothetical protein
LVPLAIIWVVAVAIEFKAKQNPEMSLEGDRERVEETVSAIGL